MTELDDIERHLLAELQVNARQTNTELAAKVGLTEGAIRRRMGRLLASGLVKVVAVVDPELYGLTTHAVIGLKVDPNQVRAIAAAAADMPELSYVYETTGQFDIIVVGYFVSTDEMRDFLQQKLVQLPGIRSADTFVVMRSVKRPIQFDKVREQAEFGPAMSGPPESRSEVGGPNG